MSPYILVPDPLPLLADLKRHHPNGNLVPSLSSQLHHPRDLFYERRKVWVSLLFLFSIHGKWHFQEDVDDGFDSGEVTFIVMKKFGADSLEEARFCAGDFAVYHIGKKLVDGDWDIVARAVLLEI